MFQTKVDLKFNISESKLKIILRKIIFKNGRLKCPNCGSFKILSVKKESRYHCRKCRKKFSTFSGTWFKNVKIPLTTFILLLGLWLNDAESRVLPAGGFQKVFGFD